jgi:hypothetical protein
MPINAAVISSGRRAQHEIWRDLHFQIDVGLIESVEQHEAIDIGSSD